MYSQNTSLEKMCQLPYVKEKSRWAIPTAEAKCSATVSGLPDDLADDFDQLVRVEGFDQPAGGTSGASSLFHLVARLTGQDQDGRGLELGLLPQLLGQANAVHARHVLVSQHQVEVTSHRLFVGILAIHRLDDNEAGVLEGKRHHLPHRGTVIDSEYRMHEPSPSVVATGCRGRKNKEL